MKVHIRERDVTVNKLLRAHVARRLGFTLARFGERIGSVVVRFSAGKGLRRQERLCQIHVTLRPQSVKVEDTDSDPFAAVDHACGRAARSIARVLTDERERERGGASWLAE